MVVVSFMDSVVVETSLVERSMLWVLLSISWTFEHETTNSSAMNPKDIFFTDILLMIFGYFTNSFGPMGSCG
jgi:hypothetical protein